MASLIQNNPADNWTPTALGKSATKLSAVRKWTSLCHYQNPFSTVLTCSSGTENGGSSGGGRSQLAHDGCSCGGVDRSDSPCSSGAGGLWGWQIVLLQLKEVGIGCVDGSPAHLQRVGAGSHQLHAWWGWRLLCHTHTHTMWNFMFA